MNTYTEVRVRGYERVLEVSNPATGLEAWIAIHSTRLGPALGGCRMWDYPTRDDALEDALRLSRAMTYKNALAGLDFGGGKATIRGNPSAKTESLLEAMGEAVEYLDGTYVTAEDVGMSFADMKIFRRKTRHVPSLTAGDPAPATARGVYNGIGAICEHIGIRRISDLSVAIQGVGCVGQALAGLLTDAGCRVLASDINPDHLQKAICEYGIEAVDPDAIYDTDCDIFSPCALGGTINRETIGRLSGVKAIAGSANNQLSSDELADSLRRRGILYAPDFVINAGGVILLAGETPSGFNRSLVDTRLDAIGPTLSRIFQNSEREGNSTVRIAIRMAEERLRR